MWVKICANTSLADALMAVTAGADAVGFVFAPSRRQVTAAQVAAIAPHLPPSAETVGVHTSTDLSDILATHRVSGLDTVQLHGAFDPLLLKQLQSEIPATSIIQALSWRLDPGADPIDELSGQLELLATGVRVLIDSKSGNTSGGSGLTFDWHAAAKLVARYPHLHFILAGGLTPENVRQAIATLGPWGVDVASGVESSPGIKSPTLVSKLIQNAKRPPATEREAISTSS